MAVLVRDHGREQSERWYGRGFAGAADQGEAACCGDVSSVVGRAGAQGVVKRQGHGKHLRARAIVEPGVEGDAHAAGDERGGVIVQQRAVFVGGIDHDDAEMGRGVVQPGKRGAPRRGH
jgi:hypothetical protein